jgi:hypothetical protein
MRALLLLLLLLGCSCSRVEQFKLSKATVYTGMANASGAVALTTNLFVVADDEDNTLRIYRADQGGTAVGQCDCTPFLKLEGEQPEADLEGGARVGDRAFWISSHGRNRAGKERPSRGVFFATDINTSAGGITLSPAGAPYRNLLADLIEEPRFARFHLAAASRRAPKEVDALNIEGLSATPEGGLLIGFRNPIPDGKALLIPLLNPNEMILGNKARFGDAILLDLGGLGIRDVALVQDRYVIIGGPYHPGGKFRLYTWKGGTSIPEVLGLKHLSRCNAEGLVIYPGKALHAFQILSDDGTRPVEGVPGKAVTDKSKQSFRSFWVHEAS